MRQNKTTEAQTTTTGPTMPQWAIDACTRLGETATVKQSPEQVLETVLRQGIKAIEKRRKETITNRIEKAKATLQAAGIQVAI